MPRSSKRKPVLWLLLTAFSRQWKVTPRPLWSPVAWHAECCIDGIWFIFPSHHIKIIFWTLRAFLSQIILTLKLSISHIIKKDQVLPSVGQEKLKYPFSQNSLADVLTEKPKQITVAISFSKEVENLRCRCWEDSEIPLKLVRTSPRGSSAILFLEARTQRICLRDEEMILWF